MTLVPLPYHRTVRDHLREHHRGLWDWFTSDESGAAWADDLKLTLLKETYRLEPEGAPELYALAAEVARAIGLGVPIHLYQGAGERLNAGLFFLPDAAHVVLHGPVREHLAPDELRSLLGHELSHHLLWTCDGGDHHVVHRAVSTLLTNDPRPSTLATWRLLSLATETFADRGGLVASDLEATVRCLVKTGTGTRDVDARAYLRQAEEVLAQVDGSSGLTHPESFLRARALALHAERGPEADDAIQRMIEGKLALDDLDWMRRLTLQALTRDLVALWLAPRAVRSVAVLGHARLFFEAAAIPDDPPALGVEALAGLDGTVLDYLAYVLLDFVAADPDLGDVALARGLVVAETVGLRDRLERFANKELKTTRKVLADVWQRRETLSAAAEASS